ncbi:hypothetical protein E5288_WYG003326 [Bos mutus]|uniref:Uncharacterized protein n=1 Tax=Bos mutus TaxID=72004 RepID=A0A6B0S0J6_9CETA|nr:hypothetical protein [Bos mutus]
MRVSEAVRAAVGRSRPPEKTGRGLCAHFSAPGPPGSLSFPSRDMGPMRAVAVEPQRAGTVCRLELPSGDPGVKSDGSASPRPGGLVWNFTPLARFEDPLGSSLLSTFLPLPLLL